MLYDKNLKIDGNITHVTPTPHVIKYITKIFSLKVPVNSSLFAYDMNISLNFLKSKPQNQHLIASAIIFDFPASLLHSPDNPSISEILRKFVSMGYFIPQIFSTEFFLSDLKKNLNAFKDFIYNVNFEECSILNECSFALGFFLFSFSKIYQSINISDFESQFLNDILNIYKIPKIHDKCSYPLYFEFFNMSFQIFSIDDELPPEKSKLFFNLLDVIISSLKLNISYQFDHLFLTAKILLAINSLHFSLLDRISLLKNLNFLTERYTEVSSRIIEPPLIYSFITFLYDFLKEINFNVRLKKSPPSINMNSIFSGKIKPLTSLTTPFFDKPYASCEVHVNFKPPEKYKEFIEIPEVSSLFSSINDLCHSIKIKDFYESHFIFMRAFISHASYSETPKTMFFLCHWVLELLDCSRDKKEFISRTLQEIGFFTKMLHFSYDKYDNEYLKEFILNLIICHMSHKNTILNDFLQFFIQKVELVQLDEKLLNSIAGFASIDPELFVQECQINNINFSYRISNCMILYQTIIPKIQDEELIERIKINRMLLLNCVENICFPKDVFTYLCSQDIYFKVIMTHFFDISTLPFAFLQIRKAFSLFNVNYPCIRYIFKFFATKLLATNSMKSYTVEILGKILDFCIDEFNNLPSSMGLIFRETNFLESLVKFSIEIDATDCIEKLLNLLNIIFSTKCNYSPNITIFYRLSNLIKSRINMSLADYLLKIAFGDDNKMDFPRKVVNQGPLPLLLEVYIKDKEKLSEYLTFIQKCFSFSKYEIFNSGLTSQLIKYLSEYRRKPCRDKLFHQAFNLLRELMDFSISPQDLLSYFQILTITPEKKKPFYTIDFLKNLKKIFENQSNILTFFNINENSKGILFPSIPHEIFKDSFSIIIRIKIIERKGYIFHLSNDEEFLTLSYDDKSDLFLSGTRIKVNLPVSEWMTFAFNYSKSSGVNITVNEINVYNDKSYKINFSKLLFDNLFAMQMKCNIEFIILKHKDQVFYDFNAYSFYRNYAVYKNAAAKVNGSIFRFQQPPKAVLNAIGGVSIILPLFAQIGLQTNDEDNNENKEENNQATPLSQSTNLSESNLSQPTNPQSIDISHSTADLTRSVTFSESSNPSLSTNIRRTKSFSGSKGSLLSIILTLIEWPFLNSSQLQSDFFSEGGFGMMGELLSIMPAENFNIPEIMKLFKIFDIITNQNLRMQMIECIFFNMNIWLYLVNIHDFYFKRLIEKMETLFTEDFYSSVINVEYMLHLTRIYLYTKYDESFCLLNDPKVTIDGRTIAERPKKLSKLRLIFFDFIVSISDFTFRELDLENILYFCYDTSDPTFQSNVIEHVLIEMLKKENRFLCSLLSNNYWNDKLYGLLNLLYTSNVKLLCAIISLFNCLLSKNLLKYSADQIQYKILTTVNPEYFNENYLSSLKESDASYAFKMPLLLYALSSVRNITGVNDKFFYLLAHIKSNDFQINEYFYYAFLLHCFLDKKYEGIIDSIFDKVARFCLQKPDPLSKIIKFTEFIQYQIEADLTPFLRKFILVSFSIIKSSKLEEKIQSFANSCFLYLFRIPSFDTFYNLNLEPKKVDMIKPTYFQIYNLMNNSSVENVEYAFDLRSTIENEWVDWEIASKLINVIYAIPTNPPSKFIEEFSFIIGIGIQHNHVFNEFIAKIPCLIEVLKTSNINNQATRNSLSFLIGSLSRYFMENQSKIEHANIVNVQVDSIFNTLWDRISSILSPSIVKLPKKHPSYTEIVKEMIPLFVEMCPKIEKSIAKKYLENNKIKLALYESDNSNFADCSESAIPMERIKERICLFSTYKKKSSRQYMKKYKQLFQSLSTDNGPWMSPENPSVIHYKMDIHSTKRTRLIPNIKFDVHREASLARDLGSFKDAQAKMKEQLAKMKLESFAGDFSLIEFDDADGISNKKNANIDVDKVIVKCQSHLITPKKVHKGYLNLTNKAIIFDSDSKFVKMSLFKVKKILLRRYLHEDTAIEIFSTFSIVYFVNFQNDNERQHFLNNTALLKVPNIKYIQRKSEEAKKLAMKLTERWQRGEISNFQYIMKLNIISGRSFNDLSQYPVFPWILKDYTSEKIDLSDPSVYRDLSLPIAAHGEERLKQMRDKMSQSVSDDTNYLYGSFYSSSAVVIGYLIRMEPFTSLHIRLQSGRFDITDRLFLSIPASWDSVTNSLMDFRELIPEFFLIPDFLSNTNNFDLGQSCNGEIASDVKLPPWAKTPRDFIEINKRALESSYVSDNLHLWIDIIFGPKSRYPQFDEANNVFHPYFYETSLAKAKEGDVSVKLIKEYAACFGICPSKIFDKTPEPKRVPQIRKSPTPDINEIIKSPIISLSVDNRSIVVINQNLHFTIYKVDDSPSVQVKSKGWFSLKIPEELNDVIPTIAANKKYALFTVPWANSFDILDIKKHNGGVANVVHAISTTQPVSALASSSNYIAMASTDCTLRTWYLNNSADEKDENDFELSLENSIDESNSSALLSKSQSSRSSSVISSSSPLASILSEQNSVPVLVGFLAKHVQPIVFIEISEHLNSVFSISRDGFVTCTSLADGRYLHGTELEMSEPSFFAVSRSGYVATAFNGPDSAVVIILDQNLEFVCKRRFDSSIICWTPCDKAGIDMLSISFKNQGFKVVGLYLPKLVNNKNALLLNSGVKIVSIAFCRKPIPRIVMADEKGKLIIRDL